MGSISKRQGGEAAGSPRNLLPAMSGAFLFGAYVWQDLWVENARVHDLDAALANLLHDGEALRLKTLPDASVVRSALGKFFADDAEDFAEGERRVVRLYLLAGDLKRIGQVRAGFSPTRLAMKSWAAPMSASPLTLTTSRFQAPRVDGLAAEVAHGNDFGARMANIEARDLGQDIAALLLTLEGYAAEVVYRDQRRTLFAALDEGDQLVWFTPPDDDAPPGRERQRVMEIFGELGWPLVTRRLPLEKLRRARYLLVTDLEAGLVPVVNWRGETHEFEHPQDLLAEINPAYRQVLADVSTPVDLLQAAVESESSDDNLSDDGLPDDDLPEDSYLGSDFLPIATVNGRLHQISKPIISLDQLLGGHFEGLMVRYVNSCWRILGLDLKLSRLVENVTRAGLKDVPDVKSLQQSLLKTLVVNSVFDRRNEGRQDIYVRVQITPNHLGAAQPMILLEPCDPPASVQDESVVGLDPRHALHITTEGHPTNKLREFQALWPVEIAEGKTEVVLLYQREPGGSLCVAETNFSNLAAIVRGKDGNLLLRVPSPDFAVEGVTLYHHFKGLIASGKVLCGGEPLRQEVCELSVEELLDAEELIAFGSKDGPRPVVRLADKALPGARGEGYKALKKAYEQLWESAGPVFGTEEPQDTPTSNTATNTATNTYTQALCLWVEQSLRQTVEAYTGVAASSETSRLASVAFLQAVKRLLASDLEESSLEAIWCSVVTPGGVNDRLLARFDEEGLWRLFEQLSDEMTVLGDFRLAQEWLTPASPPAKETATDAPAPPWQCVLVGGGRIGGALAAGLRASGAHPWIVQRNGQTYESLAEQGFRVFKNSPEDASVDVIFLAVKGTQLVEVRPQVAKLLREKGDTAEGTIVVSALAGMSAESQREILELPPGTRLVRTKTNSTARSRHGINVLCFEQHTTAKQRRDVAAFFRQVGAVFEMDAEESMEFSGYEISTLPLVVLPRVLELLRRRIGPLETRKCLEQLLKFLEARVNSAASPPPRAPRLTSIVPSLEAIGLILAAGRQRFRGQLAEEAQMWQASRVRS